MSRTKELAQTLIREPSFSGQEKGAQSVLLDYFERSGIKPEYIHGNVIVDIPGTDNTEIFAVITHQDVVGADSPKKWPLENPFSGHFDGERIWGRGSTDMKGAVAAGTEATIRINGNSNRRGPRFIFASVTEEETTGKGARNLADWFVAKGYTNSTIKAIFPEPTENKTICYGHKGNFAILGHIESRGGHASKPHEIDPRTPLAIARFTVDLEDILNVPWGNKSYGEFTPPTVAVTGIDARTGSTNKFATLGEVKVDLRSVPPEHDEFFEKVNEIAKKYGLLLSIEASTPSAKTDPNCSLIRSMKTVIGQDAPTVIFGATADPGPFKSRLPKDYPLQFAIFGPGSMKQAHEEPEWVEAKQLDQASELFEAFYYALASEPKN